MATPPSLIDISQKNNIKFDNSQSFDIKTNDINFTLKISYNDKLLFFEIEKKDEFPKNNYNLSLNFEDLGKINRFFLQFDSTSEVLDSIKLIIKDNNLSIIEENKQMKIKIINPSNQKTFFIDIPLKEKDLKSELDTIIPYIISLREKVNDLEKKSKEFEEKINELMSIKKEYEKLKNEQIKKENRLFKDSNIIKIEEEELILSWFEKKPVKMIQLLDSKKDGDSTSTFESKCAKKCPIIVIVKTTNGFRFGGFTTKIWTNGSYTKDSKCFLFSLDRKEKYKITTDDNANYLSSGGSFRFGNVALRIYNNCTSNQNNYVSNSSFSTVPQNYGMNGGEYNFTVSSYEVYQIEY